MYWYDNHMGWWGYAGMGIVMVLFLALLIAGIVALMIFGTGDHRRSQESPPTPERMLAARFAQGEISETEYRDRLAVLRDPARQ